MSSDRHRRYLSALVTALLLLIALGPSANAQGGDELEIVDFTAEESEISVTVVAPPELRDGEVTLGSFTVDIDGTLIAPAVSRIAGEQLDVVLLIDISGSMTPEALAAAKASGEAFIAQLPARSQVAVISFADEVVVEQPFTPDRATVATTLDGLQSGGETALYAAVVEAASQFDPRRDSIRTVVLLSDGGNTVDLSSLGAAQTALIASGAVLHAISIESTEANPAELESLAEATGGSVTRVDNVDLIADLYSNLAVDLRNQYRLSFEAPGAGSVTATIAARQGDVTLAETTIALSLPQPVQAPTPQPVAAAESPAPVPTTPPRVITATSPAVATTTISDNLLLKWGAIAATSLAIAIIGVLLLSPGDAPRTRSLAVKPSERFAKTDQSSRIGWLVQRLTARVDGLLSGRRFGPWLASLLDTAGWKVRNNEFIVLVGLVAVVAFFAGAISSFWMAVAFAILVFLFVGLLLMLMVARRRDAFAQQLNATLQMMAGALRTGYSLPQSIALIGEEAEAPTSEEFSRIAVEMRLGRDLVEAARAVGHRMKNADFLWTTGAIDIAREVGGDLAEVLDNVGATVRTRDRVRRQIQALSAEGRVSAWILLALPFPVFFWQLFVNRTYTQLLFTTGLGRTIFFSAVGLLIFGFFWLRSMITIDY